jgi:hypothetical protein
MKNVNRKLSSIIPTIYSAKSVKRDPWLIKRKYNIDPWWYLCEKCIDAFTTRGVCNHCTKPGSRKRL